MLLPEFNDYSNNIVNINILPGLECFNNELNNLLLEELSYGSVDANLNFMIKKDALANMDFSIENIIGWSDNT